MNCPLCSTSNDPVKFKAGVPYHVCARCRTIYTAPLAQANMVGGSGLLDRNDQNPVRLQVIQSLGCRSLLDFGCGRGLLVEAALAAGMQAQGYDRYAFGYHCMPAEHFDCVSMVEVVEHLHQPFQELDQVRTALKTGGFVYIETSFADFVTVEDGYVDPLLGHAIIFSFAALDDLMARKNLALYAVVNRNVRIYQNYLLSPAGSEP